MSKQKEIVVFREVKVGEYVLRFWPSDNGWMCGITSEMMQALTEQSAQQALDKKAENARELGLDYEPAQQEPVACECHRCIDEKGLNVNGLPLSMTKMILCPECGNKRCPKASDHRLACTNSNDLGQPGSIYTSPPAEQQEPVARQYQGRDGVWKDFISEKHYKDTLEDGSWPIRNLYTSPPAQRTWQGLTDEEYIRITDSVYHKGQGLVAYYKAIEAKLREKNQ